MARPKSNLSVAEAAAELGCSPGTVYGLCRAKLLTHSRVGIGRGTIRIERGALAEYKARCVVLEQIPGETADQARKRARATRKKPSDIPDDPDFLPREKWGYG